MCLAGAALRKSKTAALTMSFNRSCGGNCFDMCGFSTRVILSISMPSYVLLRKSCMTRWKMISRLKRGAESAKRLISAKLLCNSFAFHLFLWSSLIQYCVFRQKNARKVRNVLAGGSGVLFCSENSVKWIASDLVASSSVFRISGGQAR